MAAGFDPVEYIKKYPGRTRTTHFKPTVKQGEANKKAFIGQDSVDWASVYAACQSVGGTEWVVVEQEHERRLMRHRSQLQDEINAHVNRIRFE